LKPDSPSAGLTAYGGSFRIGTFLTPLPPVTRHFAQSNQDYEGLDGSIADGFKAQQGFVMQTA
jgi:hypothetical protein